MSSPGSRNETGPSGHGHDTTDADLAARRGLRFVLYDALASEAMGTLTTGVFLAGFAVALAASNLAIGYSGRAPRRVDSWIPGS